MNQFVQDKTYPTAVDFRLTEAYYQAVKILKRGRVDLDSNTFSLTAAKSYLGRLMEKAGNGEPVYIVRGQRRFVLQEVAPIDPIPMRPPGYFAAAYSKTDVEEDNRLAKTSVIRPPRDLE